MASLSLRHLSKIYDNGVNAIKDVTPVSYTHLDVYKRQSGSCVESDEKVSVS